MYKYKSTKVVYTTTLNAALALHWGLGPGRVVKLPCSLHKDALHCSCTRTAAPALLHPLVPVLVLVSPHTPHARYARYALAKVINQQAAERQVLSLSPLRYSPAPARPTGESRRRSGNAAVLPPCTYKEYTVCTCLCLLSPKTHRRSHATPPGRVSCTSSNGQTGGLSQASE